MQTQAARPEHFGRYQVVEELGSGAMGTVYLCVDAMLARPVAVKVLRESAHQGVAEREQYLARFRQEAEAAGRLSHPSIVQIYDIGPSYLVMEFLEGQPLSALLGAGGALLVREACAVVRKVAEALDHAHGHGVVHRDVKPANIMVLAGGRVKVMDFGVARLNTSNLTVIGTVVGSVRYMAPEQMLGQKVDGRADIFSLAALAYELLTGRAPFPGKTITEVVSRVVQGRHVPPRECDPRLPDGLNEVFVRAFATSPKDRHPTAEDFALDLEGAVASALDLLVTYRAAEGEAESTVSGAATTAAARPPAGARPGEGMLSVESLPPGADVFVDGLPRGITPVAEIELGFGRHEVRLQAQGRDAVTVEVEVGREHPVRALVVELPGERRSGPPPRRFVAFGPGITPPRRREGELPAYPAAALEEGLEGAPVLDVWISETGEVIDMAVLESAGSLLDTALLEAVGRWLFAPATRDGLPVPVRVTVQHVFRV